MSKETKVEENDIKSEIDNLSAAFQYYVQSSSRKLNNTAQQEIGRMVRWLGAERVVETITPSFKKRSDTATAWESSPPGFDRKSKI